MKRSFCSIVIVTLIALAPACANVRESIGLHHADIAMSRAQFELLKSLEGEWTGTGGDEGEAQAVEMRYRVTAAGSAVEETLFPGTPHEMVTMYHLDGERLMLTHYCAAGNQPRMVATNWESGTEARTIRFAFAGATNLVSKMTGHMHEMQMTIEGPNRMTATWTYFQEGVRGHQAKFEMTRKGTTGKVALVPRSRPNVAPTAF